MSKWIFVAVLIALAVMSESMDVVSGCAVPVIIQTKVQEVKTQLKTMTAKVKGAFRGTKSAPLHKGCFLDNREQSDLSIFAGHSNDMTVERCIKRCVQWKKKYAGVQDGRSCHCGNTFGSYGEAKDLCKVPCIGNSDEICGGKLMNSVYEIA